MLCNRFGVDMLHEVADSFTSFPTFIDRLIATRPSGLFPRWFVYARALELIKPGMIDRMQRLGVTRVNCGMDSGDDDMLIAIHKGHRADVNYRAASLLAEHGIELHCSLVLGAPGETRKSLRKTVDFVNYLLDLGNVVALDVSPLLPLPGAPVWQMFKNPVYRYKQCTALGIPIRADVEHLATKYANQDLLPTGDLARDWANYFTHVGYDTILEYVDRIHRLNNKAVRGAFGMENDTRMNLSRRPVRTYPDQ